MINLGPTPKEVHKSSASFLRNNHNEELFRVKASRMLDFFPDELVIQEKTVSIVRKDLLSTCIQTMAIHDIIEVVLTKAGLFASLIIYSYVPSHQLEIKNLSIDKANQAKEVIDRLLQDVNRSSA